MSRVEELLGRAISSDERQSVESLHDLGREQLSEVALLLRAGRVPAVQYLQSVVRHSQLDHVADFLEHVIEGGADPRSWGVRDRFCTVELELPALVHLTLADFVSALAGDERTQWYRVVPDIASWDGTSFCGSPGLVKAAAPYWWVCDSPVTCIDAASERLEIVTDLEVAFRRWLASRIAWELRGRPRPTTSVGWQQALGVSALPIDVQLAVSALMTEAGMGDASEVPPGFRAPDRVLRASTLEPGP